jgi:Protein of unknown function (DUF4013)
MPTLEPVCKRLFSNQPSVIKCLVGGVLLMVPVAHFLAFGFLYALIDHARRGENPELPSWSGWRRLFADGIVAFVIFLVLGAAPICAGWILSWPLRSLVIGPLRFLPVIPGVVLAAPLTAAGIYRYQSRRSFGAAFQIAELAGMLQSSRGGIILPTLALIGFVAVGYPLLPIALFVGLAGAFTFYSMFFRMIEETRKGGARSS